MADRYSDIMRGAQLKKALDNYIKYLSGEIDRQPNIGKGNPRPPLETLYVTPFAVTLTANQYAQVSGNKTFWDTHKTKFKDRTQDTLSTASPAETSLKLKGYRAPRVSYKTGIAQTGTVKISNATKMKYLNYGGTSASAPFGTKDGTETENAAYTAIANQFPDDDTTKVSWQREKY